MKKIQKKNHTAKRPEPTQRSSSSLAEVRHKIRQGLFYAIFSFSGLLAAGFLLRQHTAKLQIVGPALLAYQAAIVWIWQLNHRSGYSPKVKEMVKKDAETRAARLSTAVNLEVFSPDLPETRGTQPVQRYSARPVRTIKRRAYIDSERTFYDNAQTGLTE